MMANDVAVTLRLLNGRRFRQEAKQSADSVGLMGKTAKKVGGGFGSAIKGMLGFTAATAGIASVGAAIAKIGSDTIGFDTAMRNVNSIAQLSEGQFKGLEKQVLALAGPTAQSPQTLAKGLYDLVSSGFDAKQSMTILAASAKAATAGLTDTATSTAAVAAVLNAYHRPAKDATAVSDTLFQTVNSGIVTFEQLSGTIGDVLPFASTLGVNLNQVGAAISTITKEGINPFETMTRIKNVMAAFIKPSKALEGAFKKLGVSSGAALIKHKGFQGALEAVVKTAGGSKTAIAALFPNIRALSGAFALTGKNTKTAHSDLKAFANTSGATNTALSQQSKSLSFQWRRFSSALTAAYTSVGLKLLPAITRLLPHVSKFVQQLMTGTGAGGRFGREVANVARIIGQTVSTISHAVSANIGAIKSYVSGMGQQVSGIIRIVRGLVEIVTGILTLKFGRVWAGLKDVVGGGLRAVVGEVKQFTAPFRAAMGSLWNAVGGGVRSAFNGVISFLVDRLNNVIDVINSAINAYNAIPLAPNIPTITPVGQPGSSSGGHGNGITNIVHTALGATRPKHHALGQTRGYILGAPPATHIHLHVDGNEWATVVAPHLATGDNAKHVSNGVAHHVLKAANRR